MRKADPEKREKVSNRDFERFVGVRSHDFDHPLLNRGRGGGVYVERVLWLLCIVIQFTSNWIYLSFLSNEACIAFMKLFLSKFKGLE